MITTIKYNQSIDRLYKLTIIKRIKYCIKDIDSI